MWAASSRLALFFWQLQQRWSFLTPASLYGPWTSLTTDSLALLRRGNCFPTPHDGAVFLKFDVLLSCFLQGSTGFCSASGALGAARKFGAVAGRGRHSNTKQLCKAQPTFGVLLHTCTRNASEVSKAFSGTGRMEEAVGVLGGQ